MARLLRVTPVLMLLVLHLLTALPVGAADEQCFDTGFCSKGDMFYYWRDHNGLTRLGKPVSEPTDERLDIGFGQTKVFWVQYYERGRLELHTDRPQGQQVQEGLLGGLLLHLRKPTGWDRNPAARCNGWAPAEGGNHCVYGVFLSYWKDNGGLAAFGYPLTEVLLEQLEDGNTYLVQYFERVRMEEHPENAAPYNVLLGQFGRQIVNDRRASFPDNKVAACLSTTFQREPKLNDAFQLPGAANRFTIGNIWTNQPGGFTGERKLLVTPNDQYKMLVGGTFWQWSATCGPEVAENFRTNSLQAISLAELQARGLLR